ncbi:MAG: Hsp20/alpha crystallin family protein [Phycisphaerales bacterium]
MVHIIRRDPFTSPSLGRALTQFFNDPFFTPSGLVNNDTDEGSLAVDVSEDDNAVIVRASLPGFSKDEVEIECHDGVLTIKGEHAEEREETSEKFYRRERTIGSTSRRIALPSAVVEDQANAELKDGVLTVRLPKTQKPGARKIKIG